MIEHILAGLGGAAKGGVDFYQWDTEQKAQKERELRDEGYRRDVLASTDRNAQMDRELRALLEDLSRKHGIDVLKRTQEFEAGEGEKNRAHQSVIQERGFGHDKGMQTERFTFESGENRLNRGHQAGMAAAERGARALENSLDREVSMWTTEGNILQRNHEADLNYRRGFAAPLAREGTSMYAPEAGAPSFVDRVPSAPAAPALPPRPAGRGPSAAGAAAGAGANADQIASQLQAAIAKANASTGRGQEAARREVARLRDELRRAMGR